MSLYAFPYADLKGLPLIVISLVLFSALGCSEKPAYRNEVNPLKSRSNIISNVSPKNTYNISVWGVATKDSIKKGISDSSDLLSLKAQGFALQMVGLSTGVEAVISSTGISINSRGEFSSAGSSLMEKIATSQDGSSAVIIRMESPSTERLPPDQALASISISESIFASSTVKGPFSSRFDEALCRHIKEKMSSLGLNRCMVYLNSMAYDEKDGIRAEFSLFKSNTP